MIKIKKVRRSGVIGALFLLPLFFLCAGWSINKGLWLEALFFLGGWLFIFLFSTSYLFQALIVFVASIFFSISQQIWWVGVAGLLLTVYLYYANKIADKDIATLPDHISLMSPSLKKKRETDRQSMQEFYFAFCYCRFGSSYCKYHSFFSYT